MKGKIKTLIRDRGFGFINAEDGQDVFFHRAAVEGSEFESLQEGTEVEFNTEMGPKGLRAVSVKAV